MEGNFISDCPINKRYFAKIAEIINTSESLTLTYLPGTGLSKFAERIVENTDPVRGYIDNLLSSPTDLYYLDLNLISPSLNEYLGLVLGVKANTQAILAKLQAINLSKKQVYFLVDVPGKIDIKKLQEVINIRDINKKYIHFIFIISALDYGKIRQADIVISHNIVKIPYLTVDEAKEWCKLNGFTSYCTDEQLFSICQGIPFLIKNYIRIIKNNQEVRTDELVTLFSSYLDKYSREFKQVIYSLANNVKNGMVDEKKFPEIMDILKTYRLLNSDGKIIGSWASTLFVNKGPSLILTKNGLEAEEIDLGMCLTKKEQQFFQLFFGKEDGMITKDEISLLLWGPNYPQKYSNWAIDKFVSRLRTNLTGLGISAEIIKTINKVGYRLTL